MSYAVTRSNSLQFTIDGQKYALACCADEDLWEVGLFVLQGDGWHPIPPLIYDGNISSDAIKEMGMATFMEGLLPIATERLRVALGIAKPPVEDKMLGLGYNFAKAVKLNPDTLEFTLDPMRPLPSNRP